MFGNKVTRIVLPQAPCGGRGDDLPFFSKLETLNLGCNDLLYLPDDLHRFRSLRTLKIHNNFLQVIPKAVCFMMNLKLIDVESNPVSVPPLETCERGIHSMRRFYQQEADQQQALCEKIPGTKDPIL